MLLRSTLPQILILDKLSKRHEHSNKTPVHFPLKKHSSNAHESALLVPKMVAQFQVVEISLVSVT
jgi:hypothetical protein